jgi:hypothetical protein
MEEFPVYTSGYGRSSQRHYQNCPLSMLVTMRNVFSTIGSSVVISPNHLGHRNGRHKCAACSVDLLFELNGTVHMDHIIPLALGGCNDLLNLQILCDTCNLRKSLNLMPKQELQSLRIGYGHPRSRPLGCQLSVDDRLKGNRRLNVLYFPIFRVPEYSELSVPADGRR